MNTTSITTANNIEANVNNAGTVYTLRRNYWKRNKGKRYLGRWSPGLPKPTPEDDRKWVEANSPAVEQRYSDGTRIAGASYDGCTGISFWATRPDDFVETFATLEAAEAAMQQYMGHNHLYGFDIFVSRADGEGLREYRRYNAQGKMFDGSASDAVKADYRRGDLVQFLDGVGGDYQSIGMVLDVPTPEKPNLLIVTGEYDRDLTNLVVRTAVEVRRPAYDVPEETAAELAEALQLFVFERDRFNVEAFSHQMRSEASQARNIDRTLAMKELARMYADLKYSHASPLAGQLLELACGWSGDEDGKQRAQLDADALTAFADALRQTADVKQAAWRKRPAVYGNFLDNINNLIRQSGELRVKTVGRDNDSYRIVSYGAVQRIRQLMHHDGVWAKYLNWKPATEL